MKRTLLLLLAVLMLTACAKPPQEEKNTQNTTTQPPETDPQPTEPMELLLPQEPAGEWITYGPQWESYEILPLPDGVLMFVPEGEQTRVLYLQGEKLTCVAETLTEKTNPDQWYVHNEMKGFAQYNSEAKSVSFYNARLQAKKTVTLTGEQVENPCVCGDFTQVYYSTGTDLMVYDVAQGLARPLRIGGESVKTPMGLTGEESLLMYEESYPDRTEFHVINAADGAMVQTVTKNTVWRADSTRYYLRNGDNLLQFAAYGDRKWEMELAETARIIDLYLPDAKVLAADGNELSLYDLQTGKRTAKLTLPEGAEDATVMFAPDGGKVWIAAKERLYLWDTALSPADDPKVYTKKVR